MAHFYGVLQGSRGEATRCGTKDSGLETVCGSWSGAVRTYMWYDKDNDKDMVRVERTQWHGVGTRQLLYEGEV